ncbi:MAG: NB-ARC domain-containing protein, partial [Candidatus Wallbacteria bacterium]|nr:NB-ARC domain-containing protein [Candidatus Wallbacteria bacterium]
MSSLPVTPSVFCGRDQILSELIENFRCQKIMFIAGLPGIGKTSLAAAFAHHVSRQPEFRDKVFWISCRQGWNGNDLFAGMLEEALRKAGRSARSGEKYDNHGQILRILSDTGLAVFIDDFHLVESAETLDFLRLALDSLDCGRLVLISRRKPGLSALEQLEVFQRNVPGLDSGNITTLTRKLLSLCGIKPFPDEIIRQLADRINGHPLSLKLFVGQVAKSGYSPETLLGPSSDFEKEMKQHFLEHIWEGLDSAERETIRDLSSLRIPVDGGVHPFLSGRREILERLLDRYLLERDESGRVSLHNLLREFVLEQLDENDCRRLNHEAARHFSSGTAFSARELKEAYFHYFEAGKKERGIDVILKMADDFLLLGRETDDFLHLLDDAICCGKGYRSQELITSKIRILTFKNQVQDAEQLLGSIANSTEKVLLESRIRQQSDDYAASVRGYETVLNQELEPRMRAEVIENLAVCHGYLGGFERAEKLFRESLEMTRKLGSDLLEARTLLDYSFYLVNQAKYTPALEFCSAAEKIYRGTEALSSLAAAVYVRTVIFILSGQFESARSSLAEFGSINDQLRDPYRTMQFYYLEGELAMAENRLQQALDSKKSALRLAEQYDWARARAGLYLDLAVVNERLGDVAEAEKYYLLTMEQDKKVDFLIGKLSTSIEYAQFLILHDRVDEACRMLLAMTFPPGGECIWLAARCSFLLARIMDLKGQPENSAVYSARCLQCQSDMSESGRRRLERSVEQ